MAFPRAPERLALRELQEMLVENHRQQGALLLAIAAVRRHRRQREENQRNPRRWWVKPWIRNRAMQGQFHQLFAELDQGTHLDYVGFIRLDRNLFAEILHRVEARITKSPRYVQ